MGNNERRGGPSGLPRRSGVTILLDGCEKDGSLDWSRFCVGPAFVLFWSRIKPESNCRKPIAAITIILPRSWERSHHTLLLLRLPPPQR